MKYQALIYVGPFRVRFLCLFFITDILKLNPILPSWSFWPFYSPCDYTITSVTQNDVIHIFHICVYVFAPFLSLFSTDTDFLIKAIFFIYTDSVFLDDNFSFIWGIYFDRAVGTQSLCICTATLSITYHMYLSRNDACF